MKILIVEDEIKTGEYLSKGLTEAGFVVDHADNGLTGYHLAMTAEYDLVILDIMLPDVNGWDIIRMLRSAGKGMPVLLLTALGTIEHRVKGLELGADDYLVKPFAFEELMARIRCVTRRSPILTPSDPSKVCLEDLTLFIEEKRLMGPAGQCTLSQRGAVLTEVLLRAGLNTPMPRTTLLLKVWGPDNDIEDGNLDNYIHFLRRRFRQLESTLQIKTLRGTGYCLTTADERN